MLGSRLLPLSFALAAVAADAGNLHRLAFWLVLLGIPCAAGACFVAISDALEGRAALVRAVSTSLALALLVLGSAVRENAARGGHFPSLAFSTLVAAVLAYGLPALAWVLEPTGFRSRPAAGRVRPAHVRP